MTENSINNSFVSETIDYWYTIKGSFTPEQFGVFLNMHSQSVEENYLVHFHECFHYWQSIFTPYGHLKWGCYRSVSSEIIELWLKATMETPTERVIPAGSLLPCKSMEQFTSIAQIFVQDYASKIISLEERVYYDDTIENILPISLDDICPIVKIRGRDYRLNGIDILESFAKFQEATLAYIVEGQPITSTIDIEYLNPEYYSALYFFIMTIGWDRIIEFPILCELALASDELCKFDNAHEWKSNHPAWRFVKMVELLSTDKNIRPLKYESIKEDFLSYSEDVLKTCGYKSQCDSWNSAIAYASQNELNISKDMLRAIDFKNDYPWILSFPFIDKGIMLEIKKFQPYFYITSDSTIYSVDNESLGNEVIFENQYQALAHQIRGNMSSRCLDRGKLQCGFSYYGLNECQYQKSGECDGHIDRFHQLPEVKINDDGTIIEGCTFELFLSLMDISIKDIKITDLKKKIDHRLLAENARQLKGIS